MDWDKVCENYHPSENREDFTPAVMALDRTREEEFGFYLKRDTERDGGGQMKFESSSAEYKKGISEQKCSAEGDIRERYQLSQDAEYRNQHPRSLWTVVAITDQIMEDSRMEVDHGTN
ncbi:MAG: hypothetical protein HETSPECPRED_001081 [Heterodermia speciosa]|uniref:Uncharacterized protein n=1 Tax=Heterodermia speciosa TaxID=116794 RepID=A0A8H3J0J7_9LECA|nr:MAG: hypothetical protein HETSPECPRED_001081 [Heterodermia speciosa]